MTNNNVPLVQRAPIDLTPYNRYADDGAVLGLFEELEAVRQLMREPSLRLYHADSEYETAGVPGFLDSHADGPVRMLVSRLSPPETPVTQ